VLLAPFAPANASILTTSVISVAACAIIAVAVNPSSPLVLTSFTRGFGKCKCSCLLTTMPPLDPFELR
jgi:hypothetical protein